MSRSTLFKFEGDKGELKIILQKYLYSEDSNYNEITLKYLDKWIWLHIYSRDNYLEANYSKEFPQREIELFIYEMKSISITQYNEDELIEDLEKDKKSNNSFHKTHQGKDYSKEEWEEYERKQYEEYLKKKGK